MIITIYALFGILITWRMLVWFDDVLYLEDLSNYFLELFVLSVPMFIIWLWNIFDAYGLAKRYNNSSRANGRPPW